VESGGKFCGGKVKRGSDVGSREKLSSGGKRKFSPIQVGGVGTVGIMGARARGAEVNRNP